MSTRRCVFAILLVCVSSEVWAQDVPLSEVILSNLTTPIVLANPDHAAHFQPNFSQLSIPFQLNAAIAAQLSNVPLASSSGGFTWTLDKTLGTVERRTTSFGPAFAERAITTGKGKWSAGFNYQRATYDTFEGKDLDGGIQVYLAHADCCAPLQTTPPNPYFEGDVIRNTLSLKLSNDTFLMFAGYGVTDRFDLGVVLPIVHVSMNARVQSHIIRQATGEVVSIHAFDASGSADKTTPEDPVSATGIGDVILRAKYNLVSGARAAVAAAVDVRLPTGDAENLLGTGATQTKVYGIISGGKQRFSPHVNVGYTFSAGEPSGFLPKPPSEFNSAFGADFAVHPQLTLDGDIVTRSLQDFGRLVPGTTSFPFMTASGQQGVGQFEQFALESGNLNLTFGAAGLKWNPGKNLLVSAHLLFTLTDAGLRDKLTPVIGIDYGF